MKVTITVWTVSLKYAGKIWLCIMKPCSFNMFRSHNITHNCIILYDTMILVSQMCCSNNNILQRFLEITFKHRKLGLLNYIWWNRLQNKLFHSQCLIHHFPSIPNAQRSKPTQTLLQRVNVVLNMSAQTRPMKMSLTVTIMINGNKYFSCIHII